MSHPFPTPEDQALRDEAIAWRVRRGGAWTDADEAAFQAWLMADPRHADAYTRCSVADGALDSLPAQAIDVLRARLARDKAAQPQACSPGRLSRRAGWRGLPGVAFAALATLLVAGALLAWQPGSMTPAFTQTFITQRGEQAEVPLPDGSQLWLDTDTQVEVRYFPDRRALTLVGGQTMVRAQPDADRPLQVLAGPVSVTVVGTRFSVRYRPDASYAPVTQVAVEEGKVKVQARDSGKGEATVLGAGQQVESNAEGVLSAVQAVSKAGVATWRTGRVSFVDTRLDTAVAELERYGPTGLVLRDARVAGLRLTGTFDPHDARTFMLLLPKALPVRLQARGDKTEIVPE